jgi:hypothetical protein
LPGNITSVFETERANGNVTRLSETIQAYSAVAAATMRTLGFQEKEKVNKRENKAQKRREYIIGLEKGRGCALQPNRLTYAISFS